MTKLITFCTIFVLAFSCQAQDNTWYFVRHFEKQQGENAHLNELGQQHAQALVAKFKGKTLNKIYSTQYHRTLESASPLAVERGLEITIYDPAKLEDFAEQIKQKNNILIVGHSNTTPQLIRLMGGKIDDLTEQDYGQLFTLTKEQKQVKLSIHNLRQN
jgi:broad specificity phosphatase PhoE